MRERNDDFEVELEAAEPEPALWQPRPAEPVMAVGVKGEPSAPFGIYLHVQAVTQMLDALPEEKIEAGGLLVGRNCRDDNGNYLLIAGAVPARLAQGARLHLTFTHGAWDQMLTAKERAFPQYDVVGWYHTHPGLSVFLSGQDQFIHRHFFSAPQQVAIVIDMDRTQFGVFYWSGEDNLLAATGYYWFGEPDLRPDRLESILQAYGFGLEA